MLSEFDLKRIKEGILGLPAFLELILHPDDPPTPFGERLRQLAQGIEDGTEGAVLFRTAKASDLPARPGLTLSYQGRANIHYLALPEGPEAPPFVEAILDLPRGAAGCPKPLRTLGALKQPAELLVFIDSSCPHCPQAVRAANRIALTTPQVTAIIVDARQFPALAGRHQAKSLPLTVIDGRLSIAGVHPPAKLAEQILAR